MNLIKYLKNGVVSAIILAIGLAFLLGFGFNKSFDFTGGTVFQVNTTTYETQNAKNKIYNVLNRHDLKVYSMSFNVVEDSSVEDTFITVKYQITNNVDATNTAVLEELFTAFGYNSNDSIEASYITMTPNLAGAYGTAVFVNAFLAVLVAVVACGIYLFARFNLTTAVVLIAQTILDIAIMLSIVLIARIEIGGMIGVAIFATALTSTILGFVMLNSLNRQANDANNAKKSNNELVKLAFAEQSKNIFVFGLSIVVAVLILYFVCGTMASSALIAFAFGVLSGVVSATYISPSLWALAFKPKIKQPKIKNTVEVEETE